MREFWSVQAWQSSLHVINAHVSGAVRALVWRLRENILGAYNVTYVGHYQKSLYSNNDLPCHVHKIKIIFLDQIPLLCRLLMYLYVVVVVFFGGLFLLIFDMFNELMSHISFSFVSACCMWYRLSQSWLTTRIDQHYMHIFTFSAHNFFFSDDG